MGNWLLFFLFAAVLASPSLVMITAKKNRENYLKSLAERLEFTVQDNNGMQIVNYGQKDMDYPSEIYFERLTIGSGTRKTLAMKLRLYGTHKRSFLIESEDIAVATIGSTGFKKKIGETEMGDSWFDDAALVTGQRESDIRALLHPKARRIIADFFQLKNVRRIEYKADLLRINIEWTGSLTVEDSTGIYNRLLILVELFSREGKTEDLLKENFLAEDMESVKIKYLESLKSVCGRLDKDDPVIKAALKSGDSRLMLEAVKTADSRAEEYIPEIFKNASENIRIDILEFMIKNSITSQTDFMLHKCHWMESTHGKLTMLEFYIAAAGEKAAGSIREMIELHGSHSDQFYLLCISALGKCGDYDSIYYLKKQKNIFNIRETDQAIAEIQQRIGTGGKGWLSMDKAENNEGALSIEEDKT